MDRPALKYHGGKWRLAPWILRFFSDHECYVEPFCGAASVFLQKRPSKIEVLNDSDRRVVNFFRMLRARPGELIDAILATPYSRVEFDDAWNTDCDDLELARRFYVRCWQGWVGSAGRRFSGWSYQRSFARGGSNVKDWNRVDHLAEIVSRLKDVFLECGDAIDVIKRYDAEGTLFYVDPPYMWEARSGGGRRHGYLHEMDNGRHSRLLDVLLSVKGMVIVSGYETALYSDALRRWRCVKKKARTVKASCPAVEKLWMSPNIKDSQLRLF